MAKNKLTVAAALLLLFCVLLTGCSGESFLSLLSIDLDTYDPATEMIADIAGKTVEKKELVSGDYTYTLFTDGTAAVTAYNGSDIADGGAESNTAAASLSVPGELDGHTVIALENKALYKKKISTLVLPDSVRYIGNFACMSCEGLQKIVLGSSIEIIGVSAFEGSFAPATKAKDENGKDITVPGAPLEIEWRGSPVSIREKAFYRCERLSEIVIPDGCREIGAWAFAKCTDAKSIILGEGLESIGDHAFLKCTSAVEIFVPGTCKTVSISAFYRCSAAVKLTLSEGIVELQKGAFEECTALTAVTLPASLKVLGKYAFYTCTALEAVSGGAADMSIGEDVFTHDSALTVQAAQDSALFAYAQENKIPTL